MRRRNLLLAVAGAVLSGCGGDDGGDAPITGTGCNLSGFPAASASIDMSAFFQTAAQPQQQNLWCWAACISMIFAYRGHPVSQARIVSEVYGAPVNFPAHGIVIAQSLNRPWIDDPGMPFSSDVTGVYDFQAGVLAISNNSIVAALVGGTPMVIGTGSHARVLTGVDYRQTAFGAEIVGGRVFDPFFGQTQCLSSFEMVPAHNGGALIFLASVVIS